MTSAGPFQAKLYDSKKKEKSEEGGEDGDSLHGELPWRKVLLFTVEDRGKNNEVGGK